MPNKNLSFMIVCGEASGDMRAAGLVRALHSLQPAATFSGIGGEHCRQAGVNTVIDISELAVMGFSEVIKNLPRIKKVFRLAVAHAQQTRPDAIILVDYPGFNLRLARTLKEQGFTIIYYISPQIWAWKEGRVHLIKKVIDRMMVLFPFEKDLYSKHGYPADLVGHPLIDEAAPTIGANVFRTQSDILPDQNIIGLLPGSREKEIHFHLPILLKAAALIAKQHPDTHFVLLQAKTVDPKLFESALKDQPVRITASSDYYNALNACNLCVVASGTATLETGILGKPMVVIYRSTWINYFLFRLFIRIKFASLVNIISGKKVVEELLQGNATAERVAAEMNALIENPAKQAAIKADLAFMCQKLGSSGASLRAARVVLDEISR